MEKLLEQAKTLSKGKMTVILAGAAFAVAALIVFTLWNQGPDQQVLYANLSGEDSGAVIARLKEKKIPFQVDGSAITVPADKVYETRMELAGEGIPQGGGIGFEIFDKTSFGVTEFVQKVNYKRALQGELSRTITQIKEIESARVHLVIPEKGVFLDDAKKARASVVVKLRGGKALSQGQVSSIVHLVANSAENLRPEDVTVVDTAGRMWSKGSEEDGSLRLSATQLENKRSIEKDMEGRIQSMIEKAVGPEKVVARVSVDVDNKQVEKTEERYDPDGQVIRSEQRNKEQSTGAGYSAGVPGVMSNMPASPRGQAAGASTPSQSNRQDEVINYEISKVTSRVIEGTGDIMRVSVSLLVDGTYETIKGADGTEEKKFTARTDEEISKYTDMVKGVIGFSQERGDSVTVVSAPFISEVMDVDFAAQKEPLIPANMIPTIIRYASIVLISALAIIFLLRPILKRLGEERIALQSIRESMPGALGMGAGVAIGDGGEGLAIGAGDTDASMIRVKKLVQQNPQQVAMVLKSWMKEK